MKRLIVILSLAILLSGITTLLVSWACAAWVDYHADRDARTTEMFAAARLKGPGYEHWLVAGFALPGYREITSAWYDPGIVPYNDRRAFRDDDPAELLPAWCDGFNPSDAGTSGGRHVRIAHGWGWPFVALWYEEAADVNAGGTPFAPQTGPAIPIGFVDRVTATHTVRVPRFLPVRPIWGGLLLNTLIFAIAWALLLVAMFVGGSRLRRRWRLKRGRCPACRYDLSGTQHEACPECGIAIRPRDCRRD